MYVHDTVTHTVWQTDTAQIIALRCELARIRALLGDTARAETSFAVAQAWVEGVVLNLELRNKDSVRVEVPVYHEREESRHEEGRIKETVSVAPEYRTPRIVAASAWFGLGALLWIIIRVVVRMCLRL